MSLLILLSTIVHTANLQIPFHCQNWSEERVDVQIENNTLKLDTKFTYSIFYQLQRALYPQKRRIPADMHDATIHLSVDLNSCQISSDALHCLPSPESSSFSLGNGFPDPELLLRELHLRLQARGVDITWQGERRGITATAALSFAGEGIQPGRNNSSACR